MNRTEKTELASVLKEKFTKASVAMFADYKGLTAVQADDLRRLLRPTNTEVKVLKNNVARLVTKDGKMGEHALRHPGSHIPPHHGEARPTLYGRSVEQALRGRRCHQHGCEGTSSSPGTVGACAAPYTWPRWSARYRCPALEARRGYAVRPIAGSPGSYHGSTGASQPTLSAFLREVSIASASRL